MWRALDLLAIAGIVFLVAVQAHLLSVDASDYLTVNKVYVADHSQGHDPEVIYDRVVEEPFYGRWSAKVYGVGDDHPVCANSDSHYYERVDAPSDITLSWYMDRYCELAPGRYLVRTTWNLGDGLTVRNTSNVFEVLPRGEVVQRHEGRE